MGMCSSDSSKETPPQRVTNDKSNEYDIESDEFNAQILAEIHSSKPPTAYLQKALFGSDDEVRILWYDPNGGSETDLKFLNTIKDILKTNYNKTLVETYCVTTEAKAWELLGKVKFGLWKIIVSGRVGKAFLDKMDTKVWELFFIPSSLVFCQDVETHSGWANQHPFTMMARAQIGKAVTNNYEDVVNFCIIPANPVTQDVIALVKDKQKMLALGDTLPTFKVTQQNAVHFLPPVYLGNETNKQLQYTQANYEMKKIEYQDRKDRFCLFASHMLVPPEDILKALMVPPVGGNDPSLLLGTIIQGHVCNAPVDKIIRIITYFLAPGVVPNSFLNYCILGAYTEDAFLFKELNRSIAQVDIEALGKLRWYIIRVMELLRSKKAPYYCGELYRALDMSDEDAKLYEIDQDIYLTTLASTTKSKDFALSWKRNTLFVITPANEQYQKTNILCTTNVDIEAVSIFPNEQEVLYPPLSVFTVKDIRKLPNGHREIHLLENTGTPWLSALFLSMDMGRQ